MYLGWGVEKSLRFSLDFELKKDEGKKLFFEEKQSGAALPLRGLSKQRLRARQRCRRYPQQRVAAR